MSAWLAPDPELRAQVLPLYLRIFVEHGLHHGVVDVAVAAATGAPVAVAVWWRNVFAVADYDERLAQVVPAALRARFRMFDALRHHHRLHSPHLYLGYAAARPGWQGAGIGATLLGHRVACLDAHGEASLLLAPSATAARLHRRFGYVDVDTRHLPGGTPLQLQWRAPVRKGSTEDARSA